MNSFMWWGFQTDSLISKKVVSFFAACEYVARHENLSWEGDSYSLTCFFLSEILAK